MHAHGALTLAAFFALVALAFGRNAAVFAARLILLGGAGAIVAAAVYIAIEVIKD